MHKKNNVEMITIPKGGRPQKTFTEDLKDEILLLESEKGVKGLEERYGISRATAYRWLKCIKESES